ncbi:hypothetical protein LJR039_006998 [Pseudorhodoferax sp. LjRoot39]|uniref:hypothetical protein n=1 Tax=Pseudorhodoferax sp. LjRoot39 TaxID=3342328 RepID=UPI003ECF50F0
MNAPRPTHLRDARLRHALEHAPDAQALPAEATRAAILRHAHAAVARPAPVAPLPWWTRLAQALAGPRRPWNAGFATVLVACVVAGLWWERDVPGPAPDAQSPAPAMPAPATRQAPEQKESTAPAEQPATGASALPQTREKVQPPPRPARPQPQPAPSMSQAEPVLPPAVTLPMQPPADAQRRPQAAPPRAETADAPSAPAQVPAPAQDPADITTSRASRAFAAGPPRPAAAPAQARPAPATATEAFAWNALRLQPATAPARARGSLPADVLQAIDSLLRTGATAVPAEDPVLARIALLHEGGSVLGVLELGAYSMRWTPTGDRLPRAFAARVEPATSQKVRDALAP